MIATNYGIMGNEQNIITSPIDGIVLGMTTIPAVKPGEPVCHIAQPTRKMSHIKKALNAVPASNICRKAKRDLATNMSLTVAEDRATDTQ